MKFALVLLSCTILSTNAAPHPAQDAFKEMQKLIPEEVQKGNVEKWARDTLAKQEQPQAGKPHILVIGDSWADVVGMPTSTNGSFLYQRLKAHGCEATSSCIAIPATTASMWASAPFIAATKAAAKTADYVYIMLVGNDALMLMPDCASKKKSAEECADELMAAALPDMYKIVDAIHEANPKARVTGFGYDTMFGAKGCGLISHDVFPQCWKSPTPAGQGNRCFNTQFLRIQQAWEWIAGNRSFFDKSTILGATQVAGGDQKASTDEKNRHIDMDQMGPGKYWPLTMECFHPSVDNCGDDPSVTTDCGAKVVMEEFYKDYWSKQSSVCPSAQNVVV
jgi:hypothetical protein